MVQVLGCGVNLEAPIGNMLQSGWDEVKGVLSTVVGMVRQALSYVWGFMQYVWAQVMEDPWKLAHLSVTTAIMFA